MGTLLLNILLAGVWAVLIGPFEPMNFAIGFVLAYAAIAIAWGQHRRGDAYLNKSMLCARFVLFFLYELVVANVRVAMLTLGPVSKLRPGIVAVPVEPMSDTALTMLANSVTLTPGTLSLDYSDDRSTLFVHFMHVEDPEEQRREIKNGFERRILEIFA